MAGKFFVKPNKSILNLSKAVIFEEMNFLSAKYNSLNFGQGAPNWESPKFLVDSARESVMHEHQYTRSIGHPQLVNSIANSYSKCLNKKIDAMKNIVVTSGATSGLHSLFATYLTEPSDEVVCFSPYFPFYKAQVEICNGVFRTIELKAVEDETANWNWCEKELESILNKKTKFLILNNPMNPLGKLWTEEEYLKIVKIVEKFPNIIVISDEVYECTNSKNEKFVRFATIGNMWERTVSVYSVGKLFSCTGWRVGFMIGPEEIIKYPASYLTYAIFGISRPIAHAVSEAQKIAEQEYNGSKNYYNFVQKTYTNKIQKICNTLKKEECNLGWKIFVPEGGWFTILDITNSVHHVPIRYFYKNHDSKEMHEKFGNECLKNFESWLELDSPDHSPDLAYCIWMTCELGVTPIPCYPFYIQDPKNGVKGRNNVNMIRFAHCKGDDAIDDLEKKLKEFKRKLK